MTAPPSGTRRVFVGERGSTIGVVRDGKKLQHVAVTSDDWKHSFSDATAGSHRYRVQLIDATNQPIVITSHIYADISGDAGCGCQTSQPGLLLALLVLKRRRIKSVALK